MAILFDNEGLGGQLGVQDSPIVENFNSLCTTVGNIGGELEVVEGVNRGRRRNDLDGNSLCSLEGSSKSRSDQGEADEAGGEKHLR